MKTALQKIDEAIENAEIMAVNSNDKNYFIFKLGLEKGKEYIQEEQKEYDMTMEQAIKWREEAIAATAKLKEIRTYMAQNGMDMDKVV